MWKIPLFDIDFGKAERDAAVEVLESGWLTMGAQTQKLEERFAEYLGAKHAVAVCNGTAALHLVHLALGVSTGDEVICPSLTFVAGANSILYCGAECVFADIASEDDLTIGAEQIEACITGKTKAIQVMHYAGFPCDMEKINALAHRRGLFVIEDCAHAPGTEINGRKCGTWGNVGCFSFFSNKNLTCGEGGIVVTNNDALAEKLRLMRSHGMTSLTLDRHNGHTFSYDVIEQGFNYRIDELRSAIVLAQMNKLEANNEKRRFLTGLYKTQLADFDPVCVPFAEHRGLSSCHIFAVLVESEEIRNELMLSLKQKAIQTSIHYPPIHLFSRFKKILSSNNVNLPVTEDVASRLVTLPLYPAMSEADVKYVCDSVKCFFQAGVTA